MPRRATLIADNQLPVLSNYRSYEVKHLTESTDLTFQNEEFYADFGASSGAILL